jgi:hypothetical protein
MYLLVRILSAPLLPPPGGGGGSIGSLEFFKYVAEPISLTFSNWGLKNCSQYYSIAGRKKMEFVSDLMEVLNVEFQHDVKKFKIVHEN